MWVILLAMGVFSSFISSITATVSAWQALNPMEGWCAPLMETTAQGGDSDVSEGFDIALRLRQIAEFACGAIPATSEAASILCGAKPLSGAPEGKGQATCEKTGADWDVSMPVSCRTFMERLKTCCDKKDASRTL